MNLSPSNVDIIIIAISLSRLLLLCHVYLQSDASVFDNTDHCISLLFGVPPKIVV